MMTRLLILAALLSTAVVARTQETQSESQPESQPNAQEADAESTARGHFQKGELAMQSKDFPAAISEFDRAVELVPKGAAYRLALAKAHIAAGEIQAAWPVLRVAASLDPANKEVSNLFSRFWNLFDRKGVFNVGRPIGGVISLLGKPDHEVAVNDRQRVVYGFYAVDAKGGKVHELLDLRGLKAEHLSPTEYISVDLDGRGWRCDYRVANQLVSTAEYVLPDEQIQGWTELVDVQRLHGQAARGVPLQQVVQGMMDSLKKTNPDRTFEILETGEGSILFEWKTGGSENSVAQHELVRMFAGPRDMHRLAYTKKVAALPSEERGKWLSILRKAELTPVGGSGARPVSKSAEDAAKIAEARRLIWRLGGKLSGAAIMHSQNADETKTKATFDLAKDAADDLGLELAPLPQRTGDQNKDTAACLAYVAGEYGRGLHKQLSDRFGQSQAALFEVAVKSNLLTLLYAPGDSMSEALGTSIRSRVPAAGLPTEVSEPLLNAIASKVERRNAVMLVLKMHADVKLFLEKK